jgi:hypothetical protein
MEYRYVWEKFYSAVYSLIGGLELKKRLIYAYQQLSRLKKNELPKDLQVEFEKLLNEFCTAEKWGIEGQVEASLNKKSQEDLEDLSRNILSIYDRVTSVMSIIKSRIKSF